MGKTVGQQRIFICKSCGQEVVEGLCHWKKKPQAQKNICFECLDARRVARLSAQERAKSRSYSLYRW